VTETTLGGGQVNNLKILTDVRLDKDGEVEANTTEELEVVLSLLNPISVGNSLVRRDQRGKNRKRHELSIDGILD
jgi:hypothetical protein